MTVCTHPRCRQRGGECLGWVRVHEAGHYVIAQAEGFTDLSVNDSVCDFSCPDEVDPLALVRVAVAGRVAEALLIGAPPESYWRELVESSPRGGGALCEKCAARRSLDADSLLCDVCGAAHDSPIDLDDPAFARIVGDVARKLDDAWPDVVQIVLTEFEGVPPEAAA
jgi:hypothetical protein